MKLTNQQLLELRTAHDWFGGYDLIGDVLNFRLRNNLRILRPLAENVQEALAALLERHAVHDAEGQIDPQRPILDARVYNEERRRLMAEEIEAVGLKAVTYSLMQEARVLVAKEPGRAEKERLPLNSRVLDLLGELLEGEPADDSPAPSQVR